MRNTLKDYFTYQKNRRAAKKELAKFSASILPAINDFTEKRAALAALLLKLTDAAKTTRKEELLQMFLHETAIMLSVSQERLIKIFQYAATLSPQDIQKILVTAMVETMPDSKEED